MPGAPIPADEEQRLAALEELEILDTPAEERFDRLTRLARKLFDVPIALVSLVDSDRQWFKSKQGLDACETPRSVSFCGHAILSHDVLHVPDALEDLRFADSPLVTGEPHIRFYAGAPLVIDGQRVGTLCLNDRRPRELGEDELRSLRDLADCVQDELGRAGLESLVEVKSRHEMSLRAVLDTVVDSIVVIDKQGIIERVNPATERLFGYSPEEILGNNVSMLMPEPDAGRHDGYLRRYLETGEARVIGIGREVTGLHKDGSTFPLELSVSETRIGERRHFVGVVRDVSERQRAESELRLVQERLDRAFSGTSDGLWDWNVVTDTVWYSPRFKEMLGYRGDEFPDVLDSFSSHLHPDDAEATQGAVDAHLKERRPYDVEYRIRTRSGSYRWIQARGQARWDEQGNPLQMSGSIMDISDRKEAEQALIGAKEQAEESNRMKSEFLNMMSHELRTPLTVVLGYLPLLKSADSMPPAEMIVEMAGDMRQAGDHLLQLINDLLDLSKIEAGKMELKREDADLQEIVDGVVGHLRLEAEKKGLALLSHVGSLKVNVDPLRMRQVLINLAGNAVKFTEQGAVSVDARESEAGVELKVSDTGIGISEEDLPSIFDRFRQVDSSSTRKVGGTGLGLAITRSLVELHGGAIEASSRPGEGSVFTITLAGQETTP